MITKQSNLDWFKANEETVLGQLVLYHSPVDLAYLVMHNEKWDDAAIEKLKLRLEKSEGLIKKEKVKRAKDAKASGKAVVKETKEEEELRLRQEKQKAQEKAAEKAQTEDDDEFLPDDDFVPNSEEEDDEFAGF